MRRASDNELPDLPVLEILNYPLDCLTLVFFLLCETSLEPVGRHNSVRLRIDK
jgi:hypothetical protein